MIEILLSPFKIFTSFPVAALVPALVFFFLYRAKQSKRILITAILWAIYAVYESYMTYVWSRTVVAPIRVDILLIAPVLYAATIIALAKFFRKSF